MVKVLHSPTMRPETRDFDRSVSRLPTAACYAAIPTDERVSLEQNSDRGERSPRGWRKVHTDSRRITFGLGRIRPDRSSLETAVLTRSHVDVFIVSNEAHVECLDWLSPVEVETAASFRFAEDQDRYRLAHAALRLILSRVLRISPKEVVIGAAHSGKPTVPGLEFNISHSGSLALVAIGAVALGVDLERFRDIDALGLASHYFSFAETRALCAVEPEELQNAFFSCWTRKEAFLKATGDGLSRSLDSFEVSIGDEPMILRTRPDPCEARKWSLHALNIEPGYAATLCVWGVVSDVRVQRFDLSCVSGVRTPTEVG